MRRALLALVLAACGGTEPMSTGPEIIPCGSQSCILDAAPVGPDPCRTKLVSSTCDRCFAEGYTMCTAFAHKNVKTDLVDGIVPRIERYVCSTPERHEDTDSCVLFLYPNPP